MLMSFSIIDETETCFLCDYGPDWSNRGSGDGKAGVAKTPYLNRHSKRDDWCC